ncbi:hypothetical protein NDN08_001575 [Rhodosorus marinus]|uniref:Saposin B-type domain-containing protein n=1 Tax=Rhodosorus marinus TaxID=101924 RepID=A0AAV8USM5_9RHOD|nr:hypothetical protein NDN08_001575 [Rhodosorus marinus]
MIDRTGTFLVLASLVLWGCILISSSGQVVWAKPRPVDSDVKYLKCDVCLAAAIRLHEYGSSRGTKLSESELLDMLESFCDPFLPTGGWIPFMEILHNKEDKRLELKTHDKPGKCERDCATMSKACTDAIDDVVYDMAEFYVSHKDADVEAIGKKMCYEIGTTCKESVPAVPDDWKGTGYTPASEEDVEMDKLRRMSKGNVQVIGPDEIPKMMEEIDDMENVDEGASSTEQQDGAATEEQGEEDEHDTL